MALKLQDDEEIASNEVSTLKKFSLVFDQNFKNEVSHNISYDCVPRVHSYGLFDIINLEQEGDISTHAFYVMPLYEMNVKQFLSKFEGLKKIEVILEICIKLVSIFKYTHCAKRTFNDLKPENIMINTDGDDFQVFLIDFGFARKFVEKDKKRHVSEDDAVTEFGGNMIFASRRQMNFKKTSRKDDFESLFYMLIYLLNGQNLWVGDTNPVKDLTSFPEVF